MKGLLTRQQCYEQATDGKHWSRVFYDDARAKGFKYAARAHRPNSFTGFDTDDDLQAFNDEKRLFELPFVKQWAEDGNVTHLKLEPYTGSKQWAEDGNITHLKIEPYTWSGDCEHLLMAYLKNGMHRVVAYWMGLNLPG